MESGKEKCEVPKEALGLPHYGPASKLEEYNKRLRRSLFAGKDIKKGEVFTKENMRDVRPAFGLPTKYLLPMSERGIPASAVIFCRLRE